MTISLHQPNCDVFHQFPTRAVSDVVHTRETFTFQIPAIVPTVSLFKANFGMRHLKGKVFENLYLSRDRYPQDTRGGRQNL